MTKRALITGIMGQDGAYLAKWLLSHGYEVYGGMRTEGSVNNDWRLRELGIREQVTLASLDLLEISNLMDALKTIRPHEIYNLAAQSFVKTAFEQPVLTSDVNGLGALRLFEAARHVCPEARIYQASTSEMFGKVRETPQRESTPFYPRSPYGAAKQFAHSMAVNYRESYGMHISCGILFNHESPLRGREFVTRKISFEMARVYHGLQDCVRLGNMDAKRDWGYAGDYVRGMWMMLQRDQPADYVLATGVSHTVRDWAEVTADFLNLDPDQVIKVDEALYRPAEVDILQGDAARALEVLNWKPNVNFETLVVSMARADLQRVSGEGVMHA